MERTGVVAFPPEATMMTEGTDTMKPYILRDPKAVEPQKAARKSVGGQGNEDKLSEPHHSFP
jgi:hypothetical protein